MNRALVALGLFALMVTAGLLYLRASFPPAEPEATAASLPERTVAVVELQDLGDLRAGPAASPPDGPADAPANAADPARDAMRRELARAAARLLLDHGIDGATLLSLPAHGAVLGLVPGPDPGPGAGAGLGLVAVFDTPEPAAFEHALREALAGFRPPPPLHLAIRRASRTVAVALAADPIDALLAPPARHPRSLEDRSSYARARARLEPVGTLFVWAETRREVIDAIGLDVDRAGVGGASWFALTATPASGSNDRTTREP